MSKVTEEDITIGFCIVGIVMGILFLCVCIPVFVLYLFVSDTYLQRNTIHLTRREEVFEMVLEHQDELEQMIQEIEEANWPEGKTVVIIDKREKKGDGLETMYTFMKHYSVTSISIRPIHLKNPAVDSVERVTISLSFQPAGANYWGFYYSESGEVNVQGKDELIKIGDVYRNSSGHRYRYETERITDNWYYYQFYAW